MKNILVILIVFLFIGCESSSLVDPTAVIEYSIEQKSHVKLVVENSYDTVIKVLFDGENNAGKYAINFEVTNLAEGVYFYTVEAKGVESDYYYKTTEYLLLVKK